MPANPQEHPDVSRETSVAEVEAEESLASDDPRLADYFGDAFPAVRSFHDALVSQGELRGLIGPREVPRLWSRHILNSASVVPFLPEEGTIIDLGSGAGLPGIVIAAMRPAAQVLLVEPMERRCAWLTEIAEQLALTNIEVKRGRAEEFHGALEVDAVTARAVAALDKLGRWAFPLLRRGGELIVLKGRSAQDEIDAATKVLRKYGATDAAVHLAPTIEGLTTTSVVTATRTR
ncbi:16S rRNA (guanine(527)-N(7))-methyltransferase RsmG [Sanguibacter sp. A247]|uniref:16S rRNA (guanine(527)-N(7))-methyltransferase RsmG n=1 Tax=unclassified Sanguibacter TaxID=2645534 RepID=UPI003FD7D9C5